MQNDHKESQDNHKEILVTYKSKQVLSIKKTPQYNLTYNQKQSAGQVSAALHVFFAATCSEFPLQTSLPRPGCVSPSERREDRWGEGR